MKPVCSLPFYGLLHPLIYLPSLSLYETLINDLQNNPAFPLNNPMNQKFSVFNRH